MSPLVRAAIFAALLSAISRVAETRVRDAATPSSTPLPSPGSSLLSPCPAGTLPDANVCIPVPNDMEEGAELTAESNAHRERSGRWRIYDQIPRRPERPSDYRKYRFPVPPLPGQSLVMSGYDLNLPDSAQRRGPELSAVGHGGIDLAPRRGAPIQLVNLEHQEGDADVLYVGPLFGNSVVTRHSLREAGSLRDYLIIYGHLEGPAPGLRRGDPVREGTLVGFVGDSGSPGVVHLHLEMRRVRPEVNARELGPGAIADNAKTVVCDPRNVLPLATP